MHWQELMQPEEIERLLESSHDKPCFIFKHSTRCSISSVALRRIQQSNLAENISGNWYLVNVIRHRPVSDRISEILNIKHESPQLILVKNAKSIYDASHLGIYPDDLPKILAEYSDN